MLPTLADGAKVLSSERNYSKKTVQQLNVCIQGFQVNRKLREVAVVPLLNLTCNITFSF